VVVVNVGDDDAYGLTVEPANPATAARLRVAEVPPGSLGSGQRWTAASFGEDFRDPVPHAVRVTWRDRSGGLHEQEFPL